MEIYFLDVGQEKYGDCILCKEGNQTVLIDGAHPGDWQGREGHRSIPDQLEELLGQPPFKVSLLVVTHVHSDHIGCLPTLIDRNVIRPTWALVADEKLGFGRDASGDAPV